jgi:hypothetical protein
LGRLGVSLVPARRLNGQASAGLLIGGSDLKQRGLGRHGFCATTLLPEQLKLRESIMTMVLPVLRFFLELDRLE